MSGRILSVNKRKKHLSEVLFEDGTSLVLDSDYCTEAGLHPEDFMDEEQAAYHKTASDTKRAKSLAMWYLSRADHSEKGLYDKLKRAGLEEVSCAAAIKRMKELELLDDEKLARRLAKNLLDANNSPRQALNKLILKGIPRDSARQALSEQENDPKEQIKKLLEGPYRNKLSSEKDIQRTFGALVRRGFAFGDIKSVMRQLSEKLDDCEEF